MRFREITASVLAFFLLAFSSASPASSACEVKCDLQSLFVACHSTLHAGMAERQSMAGMPGMDDGEMYVGSSQTVQMAKISSMPTLSARVLRRASPLVSLHTTLRV
jgi:hypothetical protein